MKRSKKVREARKEFPKQIAELARSTAKVMVAKSMTTAHNVFDGPSGSASAMVLVTLDPEVVAAVVAVLEAMGRQIEPAADVPDSPVGNPLVDGKIPISGVTLLALTPGNREGD